MSEPQEVTPRSALVLRSLGTIALVDPDTGQTALGAGKPLALLLYLAAAPARSAGREHLLDLLWADLDPAPARHALNQTVWLLRQRLGEEAILTTERGLALGIPLDSDRERFLDAIDAGDLDGAADLYTGDFLADFALPGCAGFEHWADAERQHLRLRFQRVAESVARDRLREGHFRGARGLARRMRDADPLDESGWRLVIEICLAQDDRLSALAEAQQLEQLLAVEERVPEPATQALLLRARELPERSEQPGSALVAELVGRERQFAALLSACDQARRGVPQIAALVAPAGLGKTRLLRDLATRLSAAGSLVVYVRAHPGDRDVPWAYAAEVARDLTTRPGAKGVAPASAASLVALDPSLSAHLAATADPTTGDEARRRRAAAIADLILAVAEERSLILLLDDMHWADEASRDALQRAATQLRRGSVLIVAASRTAAALDRLERQQDVRLEPLEQGDVEALVASLGTLPDAPWARDFGASLAVATDGSPLLLLETLQLAIETGCLARVNGQWEEADGDALRALLQAGSALSRRITQLERGLGWILLLFVIAGMPLSLDLIVAASNAGPERVAADLAALEGRGLVARQGGAWSVAHDEIAAQVEKHATAEQIGAAHLALGRALLAQSSEPPVLRGAAKHLAAAGSGHELTVAAAGWTRAARERGDRRPIRALVAELLGGTPNDPRTRQLVRTLPWTLKFGWGKRLAAAAALLSVCAWAAFAAFRGANDDTGVIVATWRQEPSGHWRMYSAKLTDQDIARGSLAIASLRRTGVVSWDRPGGVVRPGAPGTLAATRAYPDGGGEEIALSVAGTEQPTRLTHSPGDDYLGSWSPDGRYLAIMTDRWSQLSHSSIAVLWPERADSVVARLTSDRNSRDAAPQWSPDGTRIAFLRVHYDARVPQDQICVVTVDGRNEHCLHTDRAPNGLIGWASPVEVVGVFEEPDRPSRIMAVNTTTGSYRELAEGEGPSKSQAPGWVVCVCRRDASEPYQLLVFSSTRPDRGVHIEPSEPPARVSLFASEHRRTYLDRLSIETVARPIPVDDAYQLVLRGWDADGKPLAPQAMRWWSGDTAIADVDSAGIVHPRRTGTVVVHASAGGWRQDSVVIHVGAASSTTVIAEDWSGGITDRWVRFGEPQPFIARTDRGFALAPNGDSTYSSGVYLKRALPAADGLGIEFEASVPRTRAQWQSLQVSLVSADSIDRRSWDLRTGNLPNPNQPWRSCAMEYPSRDGAVRATGLLFTTGIQQVLQAPPSMYTGAWVRVRIQLFPDGRCAIALNGQPRVISERRVPIGDSATVFITAPSHHTRILIGRVEIWTGVRSDIDWSVVDRRR